MATVSDESTHAGLRIDPALRNFVADELLAGLDLEPAEFWSTVADLHERFAGRVEQLLRRRDELQGASRLAPEQGPATSRRLEAFLTEIGYLLPRGAEGPRGPASTGDAEVNGPQLVVAGHGAPKRGRGNARWGSL